MILGALVDAGIEEDALRKELSKLKLDEYSLSFTKSEKHGIMGTKIDVKLLHESESDIPKHGTGEHNHSHHNHHKDDISSGHQRLHNNMEHSHNEQQPHAHEPSRFLRDIFELVDESELDQPIKNTAKQVFDRLATAEATVHNMTKDAVHLHEVSAVDSIVDIVGAVIGIHLLGVEEIHASPLSLGGGFVRCAHGVLPVPAPATLELLHGVPVRQTSIRKELVTPTGAAVITTLAKEFGEMPEMTIERIGYGAGSRDLAEQPNLLRVIIGQTQTQYDKDRLMMVETNIDDMSPEFYGYLMDKLFHLGGLDVFTTPILMKKNRPANKLSVLVEHHKMPAVVDFIMAETTTFGVRFYEISRRKLSREIMTVKTEYGDMGVKIGKLGDNVIKVVPEYEDCKRLAEVSNVPLRVVYESAIRAKWQEGKEAKGQGGKRARG